MPEKDATNAGKKRRGTVVTVVVITIALVCFVFAMMNMFDVRIGDLQNSSSYRELAAKNFAGAKDSPEKLSSMFEKLRETNPDTVGWIDIPGTDISYPVVQAEDNDFYRTHNFFKEENRGGAVFLDAQDHIGFTNENTVLYGQNMTDGSMFAALKNYQDKSFLSAHSTISIYLADGTAKDYRVFAAYIASDEGESFTDTFSSHGEFEKYVTAMKALSESESDVDVLGGKSILTLSTCEKGEDTAKYIVQAVLHA